MQSKIWSSDSSSDDDDVTLVAIAAAVFSMEQEFSADHLAALYAKNPEWGGSRQGRRKYRSRKRLQGAVNIDRDYFCRIPVNSGKTPLMEEDFHRRYRVSKDIYERLRSGLLSSDSQSSQFFREQSDCTGRKGASTDQTLFAAFRMLALGSGADSVVESSRHGASTINECFKNFCTGVVDVFENEWLRLPNVEEMKNLSTEFGRLGFPGCLGSVGCASWEWDLCPIAWQGQCKGKDKRSTVRMEVICDDYLRIWYLNFGDPGAKNDKQIFHQSPLFCSTR